MSRLVCPPGGSLASEGELSEWGVKLYSLTHSDKLFAEDPKFLLTPLLIGPVCLNSQGQFEEPICLC